MNFAVHELGSHLPPSSSCPIMWSTQNPPPITLLPHSFYWQYLWILALIRELSIFSNTYQRILDFQIEVEGFDNNIWLPWLHHLHQKQIHRYQNLPKSKCNEFILVHPIYIFLPPSLISEIIKCYLHSYHFKNFNEDNCVEMATKLFHCHVARGWNKAEIKGYIFSWHYAPSITLAVVTPEPLSKRKRL